MRKKSLTLPESTFGCETTTAEMMDITINPAKIPIIQ